MACATDALTLRWCQAPAMGGVGRVFTRLSCPSGETPVSGGALRRRLLQRVLHGNALTLLSGSIAMRHGGARHSRRRRMDCSASGLPCSTNMCQSHLQICSSRRVALIVATLGCIAIVASFIVFTTQLAIRHSPAHIRDREKIAYASRNTSGSFACLINRTWGVGPK